MAEVTVLQRMIEKLLRERTRHKRASAGHADKVRLIEAQIESLQEALREIHNAQSEDTNDQNPDPSLDKGYQLVLSECLQVIIHAADKPLTTAKIAKTLIQQWPTMANRPSLRAQIGSLLNRMRGKQQWLGHKKHGGRWHYWYIDWPEDDEAPALAPLPDEESTPSKDGKATADKPKDETE